MGGTSPPESPGFRRIAERTRFEGHLFRVATVTMADPDGEEFERDIVRHPGAVSIVPSHGDGTVTLVRQLRVSVGETVLEAPAGTCDVVGEEPAETARRELEEEAGFRAGRLERLGAIYNSPGYIDQRTVVYLATEMSPCAPSRAGTEERWMSTERVALADVEELVAQGRLLDATTIVGLLLARRALERAASGAG